MELASAHDRPQGNSHAATAQGMISSSGITFRLWRLYQHSWLVALVFPLFTLLQAPSSPAHVFFGLGGLVFFAVSYTWLMWPHPVSRGALWHSQVQTRVDWALTLALVLLVRALGLVMIGVARM
jgi:two-component system, NarL family, sensor histidine kinase DesK